MAYQAKRHRRVKEDFELVDEHGNVAHTLQVSLDADDMVAKIGRKYNAVVKALSDTSEMKRNVETAQEMQQCIDILGIAVSNLIEAVFGPEDTKTIIDFYEGRYFEMSNEVLPFISTVVMPRLLEIKQENRKSIAEKYNRKQRRALRRLMN